MKLNDPDLLYRGRVTLKAERIWGDGTHPLFQSISCCLQGGGIFFSLGAEKIDLNSHLFLRLLRFLIM